MSEFYTYLLQRDGLLQAYRSPEAAAFTPDLKDPEGFWTTLYMTVHVLAYHTEKVKKEELPKRYEDLLDPRWKGRIALDSNEERWVSNLLHVWGREKGINFLKALSKQDVYTRRGRTLLTQLLLAGEFDVQVVAYWYRVHEFKKQGAPIDWVALDPVIAGAPQIGMVANAPHPSAARLFIDFALSEEDQKLLAKNVRTTARPGVKPDGFPADLKIIPSNAAVVVPHLEENRKLYESLFLK